MKTRPLILLLVIGLLLPSACSHRPYPTVLLTADTLCNTAPDSAVQLLKQLEPQMLQSPTDVRMYYHLLCTKAADKAYHPHSNDSLIQTVLQYYVKKNNHRHLPEAYYYAGRVCRDLGDAPQALDYFQKAIEALPTEGEFDLKSRIYSQMGTLFYYQQMYDEAMKCIRKCQELDILRKDSIGILYNLRDMANIFRFTGKKDSALVYFQKAYEISSFIKKVNFNNMIQSQIAALYTSTKQYDSAKIALDNALQNIKHTNQSGIFTVAAKLYHNIGMTDSATYYYKQLLECGTIYAQEVAHRGLAEIAIKKNEHQAILRHLHSYLTLHDSIQKLNQNESLQKMISLYNYQLREKENHRLEYENEKKSQQIDNTLFILLILIISFAAYYQYNRRKRETLKAQHRKAQQLKEESYKRSLAYIEENKKRIVELEQELSQASFTNSTLQKQLEEQKELIFLETRQAEIKQAKHHEAKERIKETIIYRTLNRRLQDPMGRVFITAEEWELIEEVIQHEHPSFIEKLKEIHPFNPYEQQLCLLIKMNFSPSAISKLLQRPKETITSTRRRLFKRIFKEQGKPEEWDSFIHSL